MLLTAPRLEDVLAVCYHASTCGLPILLFAGPIRIAVGYNQILRVLPFEFLYTPWRSNQIFCYSFHCCPICLSRGGHTFRNSFGRVLQICSVHCQVIYPCCQAPEPSCICFVHLCAAHPIFLRSSDVRSRSCSRLCALRKELADDEIRMPTVRLIFHGVFCKSDGSIQYTSLLLEIFGIANCFHLDLVPATELFLEPLDSAFWSRCCKVVAVARKVKFSSLMHEVAWRCSAFHKSDAF